MRWTLQAALLCGHVLFENSAFGGCEDLVHGLPVINDLTIMELGGPRHTRHLAVDPLMPAATSG